MGTEQKPLIHVIGTGGSISLQGYGRSDYTEYSSSGNHLTIHQMLERIPETGDIARIVAEQFINVGSTSVEVHHWLALAKRINELFSQEPKVAGVVVTHGTATLEETAYFLNLTVKSRLPVVVTGAMRPPTALATDADINLLDCVRVAACAESAGRGVLTILNNEIQAARHVTKTNTYRLETFKSGELGFLGYADSDHQVVFYQTPTRKHTYQTEFQVDHLTDLPRVDIVYAYAGGDGLLIRALIEAGVPGIVAAGLGSGTNHPDFMSALDEAHERGIVAVLSSHVGGGRVVMTKRTAERGFVVADNLSPKKARILLMLALAVTSDTDEIQRMFSAY